MQPTKVEQKKNGFVRYYPDCSREIICRCKSFETEHIRVRKGFSFTAMEESYQVLLCLDGEGQVETVDERKKTVRFHKGDCLFILVGIARCYLIGNTEILKIRC